MTDVFTERPSSIDPPISDRQALGVLAIVAGIAAMAGPRRTRPLAGFLYGVALSRVHGAGRQRIEATILRLFAEKRSVGAALLSHTYWHGDHDAEIEQRISRMERVIVYLYAGRHVPDVDGALDRLDAKVAEAAEIASARRVADDDTGGGACA